MKTISGLKFATTIQVLFKLKESKNHETLQETYNFLGRTDMDTMLDILMNSYNVANKTDLDLEGFVNVLGEAGVGFFKVADTFVEVAEGLMFSGLSPEEIEERKNQMANLAKQ